MCFDTHTTSTRSVHIQSGLSTPRAAPTFKKRLAIDTISKSITHLSRSTLRFSDVDARSYRRAYAFLCQSDASRTLCATQAFPAQCARIFVKDTVGQAAADKFTSALFASQTKYMNGATADKTKAQVVEIFAAIAAEAGTCTATFSTTDSVLRL